VDRGNDDTLFALVDGFVQFGRKDKQRKKISVVPFAADEAEQEPEAIAAD
jgi:large subunit ribosomal protein L27